VVRDGVVLGRAGNASIVDADPTGHAEIRALRAAARAAGNYRLPEAVLYVTVEPCVMCVGAALHARVARLVYGCADPKAGAAGSVFDLCRDSRLNHRIAVDAGVGEDEGRAPLGGRTVRVLCGFPKRADLRRLGTALGDVAAHPLDRVGEVALARDVIAHEHAAGAPAAELHRHLLGDAAADGVPGGRAAEV